MSTVPPTQRVRKLRKRQDADLSDFERKMADLRANDTYELAKLGLVRSGRDPNETDVEDEYEGYIEPKFDAEQGRNVSRAHNEAVELVAAARKEMIATLRKDPSHKKLSDFERMCVEAEKWNACHTQENIVDKAAQQSKATNKGVAKANRRGAVADENEDEALTQDADESEDLAAEHILETPPYIKGKLRSYQIEGVNWLLGLCRSHINGILADEMGLGKTFQAVALIAILKYSLGLSGPHLVVAPKSVLGNWYREFKRWCPTLKVYKLHAGKEERLNHIKAAMFGKTQFDVIVTTYEMIVYEEHKFARVNWRYLIVDEAHKLKSEESRVHTALDRLNTQHRLLITGTPLQNNLKELWALLHFLAPRLFNDSQAFNKWFDAQSGKQDEAAVSRMHVILRPMMLRRMKDDVTTDIPPKREIYVGCGVAKKQRQWYLRVLARDSESINKHSSGPRDQLLNIVMQLRKACNHPYLFPGAEEPPFRTDEGLITSSGKMLVLDKLLAKLKGDVAGRHKVLLFSQMTRMLDILEDYLIYRGYEYCRIDGGTGGMDRDMQMAEFNNETSSKFVFLLSTRAGGLGINLQAANHVIIYDSDWNPQADLQAQDRAHRIGQKRSVSVYRFITDGTMEERIYQRALKKLYLDAMVVQQGRIAQQKKDQVGRDELLSMVKFGAQALFRAKDRDFTDADIDALLEQGEKKISDLKKEVAGDQQQSLASFKFGIPEGNFYEFEGVVFRSEGKNASTKTVHITLSEPHSEDFLKAKFAPYGEVMRAVIHPNLKECILHFRQLSSATEFVTKCAKTEWSPRFCGKEQQMVVDSEMIEEYWTTDEERQSGRRRTNVDVFSIDFPEAKEKPEVPKQPKIPGLKLPRKPIYPPHTFVDQAAAFSLWEAECNILARNHKRRYETPIVRKPTKASGAAEDDDEQPPEEIPPELDLDVPLEDTLPSDHTEAKAALLKDTFPTWTYVEYRNFINALTSGIAKTDYEAISNFMGETRSPEEVEQYAGAFFGGKGEKFIKTFPHVLRRIEGQMQKEEKKQYEEAAIQWKYNQDPTGRTLKFSVSSRDPEMDGRIFARAVFFGINKIDGLDLHAFTRSQPHNIFNISVQSRLPDWYEARVQKLVQAAITEKKRLDGIVGKKRPRRQNNDDDDDRSPSPAAGTDRSPSPAAAAEDDE